MNANGKWLGVGIALTMLITTGCASQAASSSPTSETNTASGAQQNDTANTDSSNTTGSNDTQNNTTSIGNELGGTGNAQPSTTNYVSYTNSRYGFSLSVPSTFVKAPASQNGDGQDWYSPDNEVKIQAFGQFNVNKDTVASELASLSSSMQPTYHQSGANWAVVSGYSGSNIVYDKVFVGSTNLYELQIQYPKSAQSTYGSIVSTIAQSFQPGSLS
ncbi:hypothetical protein [Alicyclobacillus dauci]|uniref:Sporulation lipoprotein YhcN/YlaJ (Spore_YhcN_YlaJ) n=1 Tax=Alicyclobacillus dauci TaxID=1475485 RepID=A0ABY6Z2Q2_9BACL|nr:hypothetical protein [Alicyclobacillus dauci]WAH36798.1 hypothetical protein NZD86_21930 [Alicyclobacillus dauci]